MAYASGEKRNSAPLLGGPGPPGANAPNVAASGPSPPSQPRKSNGSRPVLSARSTTASNGGPTPSGPLVASMLGGSFHNRTASPAPQRTVSSQQHATVQRSTSASLQRTSSSRQRSSHGQIPGKPFFAAYGLQYSSNGRNGSAMGSATSRTSGTMSPYRNRPSSSTGPASPGATAVVATAVGRPSTSQASQRSAGENWFGNTKLSVTLPNEAARVVHELGQLLSVFAPPAPSTGPQGPKAPGSFRASKYVSGSNGAGSVSGNPATAATAAAAAAAAVSSHKEAWGSIGGMGGGGSAELLMRPTSAASSTGSASKPLMAPFMNDGRQVHGQGANLSLMRLQQQQQQQPAALYSTVSGSAGGVLAGTVGGAQTPSPYLQHQQHQQHQQTQPSHGGSGLGQNGLGSPFLYYPLHGSGGTGSSSQQHQQTPPPRLNIGMVGNASGGGSGGGGGGGGLNLANNQPETGGYVVSSPAGSPTSSPHGVPPLPHAHTHPHAYSQAYPHSPVAPQPNRPWEAAPSSSAAAAAYGYSSGHNASYAGVGVTTAARPVSNGNAGAAPYHYLPAVDGTSGFGAASGGGASPGYMTMNLSSTAGSMGYSQVPSFHASTPLTMPHSHAANAPYNTAAAAMSSMSAAMTPSSSVAAAAAGGQMQQQSMPVATTPGPISSSSLAPSSYSTPLQFGISAAVPSAGSAAAATTSMLYNPAAKAMRDSLLAATTSTNSSSGNVSSPSSSASQVQPVPGGGAGYGSFLGGGSPFAATAAASSLPSPLNSFRSSSLANAPHPLGLPPPSPLKAVPPPGSAPGSSRGTFMRSNSSRSSNGSGCDNGLYYNGTLLPTVQDVEREDRGDGQEPPQVPLRPTHGSGDGGLANAANVIGAPTSSPGGGSGGHVTWAANIAHGTSAPGTPTRMQTNSSYGDLTSRRVSSSQMSGFETSTYSSPFARGSEGYSRTLMEHGTLTCVRPSTVPSNFAADSQPDLGGYGDQEGSGEQGGGGSSEAQTGGAESLAPMSTAMQWAPSGSGLTTATSNSTAAAASALQPWRRSTENADQLAAAATGHVQRSDVAYSGSSTGMPASYATAREDGVWGRTRDATPTRLLYSQAASGGAAAGQVPYSQQPYGVRQAQHLPSSDLQRPIAASGGAPPPASTLSSVVASAAATSTTSSPYNGFSAGSAGAAKSAVMSVDAMTSPSAFASAAAMWQVDASAASAGGTSTSRFPAGSCGSGSSNAAEAVRTSNPPAPAASTFSVAGMTAAAAATATSTPTQLPYSDTQLRPRTSVTATPTSPSARYSPWTDMSSSRTPPPQGTATATPTTPAPTTTTTSYSTHPASSSGTVTTNTATGSSTTAAATIVTTANGSTSMAPAAPASSAAASSAAGSAVSSGSTSSGTASSSAGYPAGSAAMAATAGGSSGGGSATATATTGPSTSSSSAASTATAVAAASAQHVSLSPASRRISSVISRFNPVAVLGSEIDATFGTLLPGYSVGKVIGEGGFCQVRLAVHHLSQRKVAVKVIDRAKLVDPNEAKRMQREIRVMKHLSHQCVIKLFEVVESPKHLFLVMEHAPAGSLLDYVRARKRLPEADACVFFQQIVASLEYCHSREVVHRDIKLENILLDVDQRMKLIDFGLSAFFVPAKRLRVHCGSPSYAAPEIVARKAYEGPPVDVWSLGVVLFAMVAGYLPFHASGGNKQELCNKIIAGQYTAPEWLSTSMKDLLGRMLTTDPDKRITFPQVWQHSWVRNGPQWHERGVNCYEVLPDTSALGGLRCDELVVAELEAAGYSRSTLVQHLVAGEANHITASYFLLCEAKAETLRRMRGGASSNTHRGNSTSRSSGSSPATTAAANAGAGAAGGGVGGNVATRSSQVGTTGTPASGSYGSAQLAAAVAKARTVESPGRGSGGSSSSRPSTAAVGGSNGYSSARGHRGQHQGEDLGMGAQPGRMAVAV